MISDEFETFGDDRFGHGQTKTKILIQKTIHFMKIHNVHSKQIFICLTSRIFFQNEYSFFKNQIIHSKNYSFF